MKLFKNIRFAINSDRKISIHYIYYNINEQKNLQKFFFVSTRPKINFK